MDRGLSLNMIGRGITWTDVMDMMAHLPHDSHTRRLLNPEGYRDGELGTVTSQILGEMTDVLTTLVAVSGGKGKQEIEQIPRSMDVWRGSAKQPPEEGKNAPPEPKRMTPAEVRAAIAARTRSKAV